MSNFLELEVVKRGVLGFTTKETYEQKIIFTKKWFKYKEQGTQMISTDLVSVFKKLKKVETKEVDHIGKQ